MSARFGVDVRDSENAQRLSRYTQPMREAIAPADKAVWCDSVRGQLEKILKGLGDS